MSDDSWSQLPGESAKHYEYFLRYLTSPDGTTLAELADTIGVSEKTLRNVSSTRSWRERAATWRAETAQIMQNSVADVHIDMFREAVELTRLAMTKSRDIITGIDPEEPIDAQQASIIRGVLTAFARTAVPADMPTENRALPEVHERELVKRRIVDEYIRTVRESGEPETDG